MANKSSSESVKRLPRIWKYFVPPWRKEFSINMPKGAKILSLQKLEGIPAVLWAMVDPDAKEEERNFIVFGPGQPIKVEGKQKLNFIGTYHQINKNKILLIWHVFELIGRPPRS